MKTGIELIAEERKEQIEKHGFTAEKDAQYVNCELEQGALHAIEPSMFRSPENWGSWFEEKMKGKDEVERLIVAGALIAAAIDRLMQISHATERTDNTP
jgi:hypothetical protein